MYHHSQFIYWDGGLDHDPPNPCLLSSLDYGCVLWCLSNLTLCQYLTRCINILGDFYLPHMFQCFSIIWVLLRFTAIFLIKLWKFLYFRFTK
jgi:hypothetical protein